MLIIRWCYVLIRWCYVDDGVGFGWGGVGWVCSGYRGVLPGSCFWYTSILFNIMSEIDDGLQYIYATLQMVITYSILFNIMSEIDDGLQVIYMLRCRWFTKKIRKTNGVRLAGTQQIERVWFHVKKSIPKTLNNRKAGYLNETDIMKCVWVFLRRRNCHNDMYKCLGDLCRKSGWNKDVGNAEEKAYSCLFQHDGFRPTKTIEITPWLSFVHTLPWLLTHPQNIDICEKSSLFVAKRWNIIE